MSEVPKTLFFESVVRNEQRGKSLPEALAERFTYHSAEDWKEKIGQGLLTLNGIPATSGMVVQPKDKIVYRVENYSEPEVPTDFDVLYEDEFFLIVSKPAGIPVHHTGRIFYNTFTGLLRRHFQNEELSPMHRLDRDTGGIMIFAKDRDTAKRFEKSLDSILLRKIYLAFVRGEFPDGEILCEQALAEDPQSDIRIRMFPKEDGKPCKTLFRRVATVSEGCSGGTCSLVGAELFTGRKHQIRAHLSFLGYPVVGDKIYSFDGKFYKKMTGGEPLRDADFEILGAHTQMLFAAFAQIRIPGEEPRWFAAPRMPPEMAAMAEKIESNDWKSFWKAAGVDFLGPFSPAKRPDSP